MTHEMLFDALAPAFRVLGGVPRRGIFDNMKTAVDRLGSGKARGEAASLGTTLLSVKSNCSRDPSYGDER